MVKIVELSKVYNKEYKSGTKYIDTVNVSWTDNIDKILGYSIFDENPLLKYDNWTYHIQFYMIPSNVERAREYLRQRVLDNTIDVSVGGKVSANNEEQRKRQNEQFITSSGYKVNYEQMDKEYNYNKEDIYHIKDKEKVVIFETGVISQYNLQSLNFKTVYSDSSLNGFIHLTDMTMVLNETLGCSLLDKWNCVSRALGWENNINMPYYMEISFKGYDSNTGLPIKITPNYLLKLYIKDVKTQISNKGTTYTFSLAPFYQYGFQKDNFLIENIGQLGEKLNGSTFKSYIEQLETFINEKYFSIPANKNNMSAYSDRKRYEFIIDEAIQSAIIKKSNLNSHEEKQNINHPNPKDTIQTLVKELWNYVDDEKFDDTELRLFTKQVIVQQKANDGSQLEKIYYFIVPVKKPFMNYYMEKMQNKPSNIRKYNSYGEYLNYLIDNNLLKKKYEYLFSGTDVNVQNFDFKLNYLWYIKSLSEKIKINEDSQFNTTRDSLGNLTYNMEEYSGKIDDLVIQSEANKVFLDLYGNNNSSAIESIKYIDDVNSVLSDTEKFNYLNYKNIPVRNSNLESFNTTSVTDVPKPIIKQTALEEMHSAGEMSTINFEILGDPYWLADETYDGDLLNMKTFTYESQHILFKVKTPVGQSLTNDLNDYSTCYGITGAYIPTQIEHNFTSSGKFTQKITAVIDPYLIVRGDYEEVEGFYSANLEESLNSRLGYKTATDDNISNSSSMNNMENVLKVANYNSKDAWNNIMNSSKPKSTYNGIMNKAKSIKIEK